MAERLYLVGMMGAGKSVVGQALAELLGWSHVDVDAEIETTTGMTTAEVFSVEGEPRFRDLERAVIARVSADEGSMVVSCGGGAVLDESNRTVLHSTGTVVWLKARPDTLARRVGEASSRPVLAGAPEGDVLAAVARLDAERTPLYTQVADIIIDVDDIEIEDVARHIAAALPERTEQAVPTEQAGSDS